MGIINRHILNIFTKRLSTNIVEDAYSYVIGMNRNFFANIDIVDDDGISCINDEIYLNEMLSKICKNCKIDANLLKVSFSDQIKTAGNIQKNMRGGYDIHLNTSYKNKFKALGGILAHEIMHVWVEKYYIGLTDIKKIECITDLMTVFNGCGILLIRANEESSEQNMKQIHVCTDKEMVVGHYISTEELGYAFILFAKAKGLDAKAFQNRFSEKNRYLIHRGIECYARRKEEIKGMEISKVRIICSNCFKILQYDYIVMSSKLKIRCPHCGNIKDN